MTLSLAPVEEVLDDLVQSQVEALFKRASDAFSEEPQLEKKYWKTLFYVAYKLRRFDSVADLTTIELQYCRQRKDVVYELFLRVCWVFPDFTIHHIWNGEGSQRHDAAWQHSIPGLVICVFDLKCVKNNDDTPKLVSEELIRSWENALTYGLFSMRV